MKTSIFEIFKIGIGPSSSHTVGPMLAARRFLETLQQQTMLASVTSLRVELYGSLALTGRGHATDRAVMLGLLGDAPDEIDPSSIEAKIQQINAEPRRCNRHLRSRSSMFD